MPKCRSSSYLRFKEAQKTVQKLGIKNRKQYKKLYDSNQLPKGLPGNPVEFYKRFKKIRITFQEAKQLAKENHIKNSSEWRELAAKNNKDPTSEIFIPPLPAKNTWKEWTNWYDFLEKKSWKEKPPLSELKAYAIKHKVKNMKEWYYLEKPENYVKCPSETADYKDEWISWYDFLDKVPISIEEGKKIAQKLKIKSCAEYIKLWETKKLPEGMPSYPPKCDRWVNDWKGWEDFLNCKTDRFLEYEEAKKLIRKYKLKTTKEYKELRKKNNKIRKILPVAPYLHYKKEWKSWGIFLGNGKIPLKERTYLTYNESQKHIQKLGIITRETFYEKWKKLKLKDKKIPFDPERVYKRTGEWEGWTKFFGKNHNHGNYVSFEECKRMAQKLDILRANTYRKLAREGKLPKGMPHDPQSFYKRKFFERWLPFEQARKIIKKHKFKSIAAYTRFIQKNPQLKIPITAEAVYGRKF